MTEASWGIRRHLRSNAGPYALACVVASVTGGCAPSDATRSGQTLVDAGGDTQPAPEDADLVGRARTDPGDKRVDAASPATSSDAGAGDDGTGPPTFVTLKQGCDIKADKQCLRLQECSEFFLRLLFGKAEACRSRLSADCVAHASAPDIGVTPYSLVRCAQEISSQTCADIIDRKEPDACNPMGLRREGSGCGSHFQCATGFCKLDNGSCGRCEVQGGAGEMCESNAACVAGLLCGQKGKCVRRSVLGEACSGANQECSTFLACAGGKCVAPVGGPCTNPKECMSNDGEPGVICREGDSLTSYCSGGQDNCVKDSSGIYRCVEPALDGQPCGDQGNGRSCVMPAVCVAGMCRLGPLLSCQS
jgi:hypothetical protein